MWTLSGKCKIDIQREETIKIVKHKKTYIPFFFFWTKYKICRELGVATKMDIYVDIKF